MCTEKYGRFQVGIGVILEHAFSKEILLLRRSENVDYGRSLWDNIGGRMNQNENPEDSLRREVKEETGITDLTIIKPLNISHYFRGDKIPENETIVINFWCQTQTENVTLSEEHDYHKWIHPEEALSLNLHPTLKDTILKFLQQKKKED